MTKTAREYRGIKNGPSYSVSEILAVIYSANKNEGHDDWSCKIECPSLLKPEKHIVGTDAEQALEFAIMFVKNIFEHNGYQIQE
jgi:hypothetical protein